MKTINTIISEKQSYIRAQRSIRRDDSVEAVYNKYPELQKIDKDLFAIRKSLLLADLDGDDKPVPALKKRESELISERSAFLTKNSIDPNFDEESCICDTCKDTGYTKTSSGMKVVCTKCMLNELNECFRLSGMQDYDLYNLKSYNHAYFDDKKGRKARFDSIKKLFEDKNSDSFPVNLYIDKVQSGKTYLSVVLVKYSIIEGLSGIYTKAERITEMDEDDIDFIKSCDFLVIDDFAPDVFAKWNLAYQFNNVLEARIAAKLPTLIVSSLPKEVLISDSDARVSGKLLNANVL